MCIAHVICPVGVLFCAMARCRDGHPCQVAHAAAPLRVCWRNQRRDHASCPWGPDVIHLPPSVDRSCGTSRACLPAGSSPFVSDASIAQPTRPEDTNRPAAHPHRVRNTARFLRGNFSMSLVELLVFSTSPKLAKSPCHLAKSQESIRSECGL